MKIARFFSLALASALLAGAAGAQATWIVDDDGGAGVHFTDIQPAIDAASAGDVIRVFPGTYDGFTLDKPLVVVGQPGAPVFVNGYPWIRNIVAPSKVVVSHLAAWSWRLENCTGAVLLDDCDGGVPSLAQDALYVTSCSDLRIQRSVYMGKDHPSSSATAGGAGIRLSKSRLQLNHAWVRGGQGALGNYGYSCDGYDGGAGIEGSDSNIHVYSSSIYGGAGGDDWPSPGCGGVFGGGTGGDGGDAVKAASVLAVGPASLVLKGGSGGAGGAQGGKSGKAIMCSGDVRLPPPNPSNVGTVVAAGTVQIPDPPDPTLSFKTPQPVAGEPLRFMVHGPKDAIVTLLVGREPVLVAPTALKERRLVSLDQDRAPVGVIDGSGVKEDESTSYLIVKIHLPSTAPHGFTFLVQAELVYPDGETRYTNSLTVVLP